MNILLTNHHFQYYGGSETATLALYQSLVKKGHTVAVWSAVKSDGGIKEKVNFKDTLDFNKDHFDVAFVNHNSCLSVLNQNKRIADKIIFTSHGPLGGLEQPIEGADLYCGVSEEIVSAYPQFDMKIVRNGVNLNRFVSRRKPSDAVKTVLLLSNRTTNEGIAKIQQVCDKIGVTLIRAGLSSGYTDKVENVIDQADFVITAGRGVLESMAMSKPVLMWDHRPYNGKALGDGLMVAKSYLDSRTCNFSGRAKKVDFTVDQIAQAIKTAKPPTESRQIIERYHDIDKIVDRYFTLVNIVNSIDPVKKKIVILGGLTYFHRTHSLAGIIKSQARMFAEQGHDTTLVVSKNMARIDVLEETGAKVLQLLETPETTFKNLAPIIKDADIVFTHDFVWLEAFMWLNKVCSQLEDTFPKTTFVHMIHSSPGSETCPDWKKGKNKPNVLYSHPGKEIGQRLSKYLSLPQEKIIQIEYTQDFIEESGGDENLWHELDMVNKDFVGIYPAHPYPGKNIEGLLHIIWGLKQRGKSVKYFFTCNGVRPGRTRVDDYKDLAKKLDIENEVVWMYDLPKYRGQVEHDVVHKIFTRSNIFIHPSISEANPSILLEAMAHGCLIVANSPDFPRFEEMLGNTHIPHGFGAWNVNMRDQTGAPALSVADAIITYYERSLGLKAKDRAFRNYNRRAIYNQYQHLLGKKMSVVYKNEPLVSIVIPILNMTPLEGKVPELIQFTKDCIQSIGVHDDVEVIIINNNPDDHIDYTTQPTHRQINNEYNVGVPRSWNLGIQEAKGTYIMILNSDVILSPDWKQKMLKWNDGLVFPWYKGSLEGHGEGVIPQELVGYPQIQGSCFVGHKSVFNRIGPFRQPIFEDDLAWFAYAEDQDYWNRVKLNNIPVYRALTTITHKGTATSSKITGETLKNPKLIEKHGTERIMQRIFQASNEAYKNIYGQLPNGVK